MNWISMNVLPTNESVEHSVVQIYQEIISVIAIFSIQANVVKIVREDSLIVIIFSQ